MGTLKRKYDSSRRQQQARETQRQIVDAARVLFLERGYAGTTIDAIAQNASVAPETVYATFGNKRKIFWRLLDVSVGGDEQPIPLMEREGPQAVLHDQDARRQIQGLSRGIAGVLARVAPLFEVMRAASRTDAEIAALLENMLQERLKNMHTFVKQIAANSPLRAGLEETTAGATVWAVSSPEVFLLLTRDQGWTLERYSAWLEDTLARLLLP